MEKSFRCSLTRQEWAITLVDVVSQKSGAIRVRAREIKGRHAADVSGQTSGHQVRDSLPCRDKNFAAHVTTFLFTGELILQMNARRSRFDHCLNELKDIEWTTKAGFRIRHDGSEPIDLSWPSACWIWSARWNALLIRLTTAGTLLAG